MNDETSRTAIIIGATGLIGNLVLNGLLATANYTKVIAITRKPIAKKHPKLNNLVLDFEQLENYAQDLIGHDAFCCLGSTIKNAGSRALFRHIDFDYSYAFAKACLQNNSQHFLLISAIGANAKSPIFYNQVKGDLEKALADLDFPVLSIFQPSLLLGERNEQRFAEELAIRASAALGAVCVGPLRQYHPVKAEMLAKAMINCALDTPEPHGKSVRRFSFKHIKKFAAN